MNYTKPEVIQSGLAIALTQGVGKGMNTPPDGEPKPTNAAYEADE